MGIIFCILTGLFMCLQPVADNDFFWHTVVGNYIWDTKSIPSSELFSWVGGKPWVAHEWLNEVIMYKLGPIGCIIIMLIIFLCLYIVLSRLLRLNFKKIFDFRLLYFLMVCVFFKVTGPRPYIISLLFFAILLLVLYGYLENNEKFKKWIWSLPILQILWVNFHGGSSSLIAIFLAGILLSDLFLKIIHWKEERFCGHLLNKREQKTLLINLVLVLLASCINPFGYQMLIYPYANMLDASMTSYIVEWQSASYHGLFGLYIFILMAIPLLNLALSGKKMRFYEIAFQFVFFYMAMKSQRFIGMYAIYSCVTLGKYFFITEGMMDTLKKPFKKYSKVIYAGFISVLCVAMVFVGYKQINSFAKNDIIDNDGFYSDSAIEKLIEVKPQRLYNDYSQGGYLLYKLNEYQALDKVKVFSYGLGDVFSQDLLPDTVNLQDLLVNPQPILDKYNFDYLITTKQHTLQYYLSVHSSYELIYKDDMCSIFHKKI